MQSTVRLSMLFGTLLTAGLSSAAQIEMSNGDRVSGRIAEQSPDTIVLDHAILGRIEVPRDQIADLQHDEADAAEETNFSADSEDTGLLSSGWFTDWKRRLEIGVAGSAGKSDDQKINIGFAADYEDEQTRWTHRLAYYRNEAERELSDHSFFSTLHRDWLRPGSPWFQFAGARLDWDEFKDWDYRLAANAGAGYEVVKTDNYRLITRAGLGGNQTFGGTREEFTPEALFGIEVKWKINDHQAFAFVNTLHPNLEEIGEYRNLTTLDWTLDLDDESGLGLKISLTNEYDSLAEDSVDANDFKYAASLVWAL